jgi:hypothetical protein
LAATTQQRDNDRDFGRETVDGSFNHSGEGNSGSHVRPHGRSSRRRAREDRGIPEVLPRIFPGCKVSPWRLVERSLTGHVKAAVEAIEVWVASARAGAILPFKTVSKALSFTSHAFGNDIRFHPDFMEAVAELGLIQSGKGVYFTGFTKAADA